MRIRIGPYLGVALLALSWGCAPSRPCQVIPKQLELARYNRDQVRVQLDQKAADVARAKESLDLAQTRLQQMVDEQAELEKAVAQQAADSAAAARRKK